jgi:TRAP-type C4-dicarboxylate transport system permease small subunit|tara:strand:- start:317 stop:880 length:564 start_codon:yes stop_codon:yes gene_type:complete
MTSLVTAATRLQDRLEELLCYISALAVAGMMVITTLEVIARAAFYKSVPGSYQYVSLLFVYLIYLGLAFSQRRDAHITIGIVYDNLPRKARQIVQGVFLMVAFVFFAAITWTSAISTWDNYVLGDTVLGAIEVQTWWARAGVPAGCALFSLRFLTQLCCLVASGELYEETAERYVIQQEAEQSEKTS